VTRLWWVRHGPTHAKTLTGWRDIPADLTDTARIARLNAYLPANAVIVASDLIRASATANALAGGRQRLPDTAALREFNFGDWDGKHFSDVAESHPALSRAYWEAPGDIAPPGGESWNTAAARVGEAVSCLLADHGGRDIILVAHIGVILTQVQIAAPCTAFQALAHTIDNLSVTDIGVSTAGWQLGRINHVP
jgi:broad specificity phosphatase PhoE